MNKIYFSLFTQADICIENNLILKKENPKFCLKSSRFDFIVSLGLNLYKGQNIKGKKCTSVNA